MDTPNALTFADRTGWQEWLEKKHMAETEVWLVLYKKHSGKPGLSYQEAVEEALCYGWIDSKALRVDEEKYMQRFTPRKNNSNWSALNLQRVEKLVKEGRMTLAGLAKVKFQVHKKTAENS
ncbi:MAG: YdeI/OmpD-associated family protein [Ignavibacteriales bacterium]